MVTVFASNKLLRNGSLLLAVLCLGSSLTIIGLQWPLPFSDFFAAAESLPVEALLVRDAVLPRMLMALLIRSWQRCAATFRCWRLCLPVR